jgi:hypothetical protein
VAGDRPPGPSWRDWIRGQPALAAAVGLFCLAAIVGLVLTLPEGLRPGGRASRIGGGVSASGPAELPGPVIPRGPDAPAAPEGEAAGYGPWVGQPPSAPSPRGVALAYAYRTRPPGGDSRFDWFVRLVGAEAVLNGVAEVAWRMDPPPRNGDDLVSRDRARDGFPLLGDGPGGWFGVSALVRYKDGAEETLARRIELPD